MHKIFLLNKFLYRILNIIFFSFLILSSCQKKDSNEKKITIITTIFPFYDFAKQVGKDKVNVVMLIPPGVEIHSFEPRPRDIISLNEADIFIYGGSIMDIWASDILKSIKKSKHIVVDASAGLELMDRSSEGNKSEDSTKDPHYWLDFDNDLKIINTITDALIKKDAVSKEFYMNNARIYKNTLLDLDDEYKRTLKLCKYKTIIYAGHFAFGYFARRYGLSYLSPYKGISPDSEPTPRNISELIEVIKKQQIQYIFFEELLEPKLAKVIEKETGVKLLLLHAGHNISKDEFNNNETFLQIMKDNLTRLKTGLEYSP